MFFAIVCGMTVAQIETKIWRALKAQVDVMSTVLGLSVAYPKQTYDPASTNGIADTFLVCDFVPNTAARVAMQGGYVSRRDGILSLALMSPMIGELQQDIQLAALVSDYFNDAIELWFDGQRVTITKEPDISQGYRDGGYWRTPITIRWLAIG